MTGWPHLSDYQEIEGRLLALFPEGIDRRSYLTREICAKTVFVMLYVGAIQGRNVWVRPDQITRMSDEQSIKRDDASRSAWAETSLVSKGEFSGRWYATNTREPIRDETLRQGLVEVGAVIVREGIPTTSPLGRYALSESFAHLFSPELQGDNLTEALAAWRETYLTRPALSRLTLLRNAVVEMGQGVLVTFPNKETRRLACGPSSNIVKAVIEEFAPRFLSLPGVIFISESAQKETWRDTALMKLLNLKIESDKILPDLILVDLQDDPLFIFVEVVASDGPITPQRKEEFLKIIEKAGYPQESALFVTAFIARNQPEFRRLFPSLAWGTYVWCLNEPDNLISLICDVRNTKLRLMLNPSLEKDC